MNRNAIAFAAAVTALGIAGAAFAQGDGDEGARQRGMQRLQQQQQMQRNHQQPAPRQAPAQRSYPQPGAQMHQQPGPQVHRQPGPLVQQHQPGARVYDAPRSRVYEAPAPRVYSAPGPRVYERGTLHGDARYWRGAGPDYRFSRGAYLPHEYRGRGYWISDWHRHHLHRPPPGYRWVRVDGDFVLVAVGTGVIMEVLLAN